MNHDVIVRVGIVLILKYVFSLVVCNSCIVDEKLQAV